MVNSGDESVNHPTHYGGEDSPHEVIKVLRAWLTPQEYAGFLKGNAIKYLARHRDKGGLEDLRKAEWYQAALAEFVEAEGHDAVYPPPLYWGVDGAACEDDYTDIVLCGEVLVAVPVYSSVESHASWWVRYPISEDGDTDAERFGSPEAAEKFIEEFRADRRRPPRGAKRRKS